MSEFGGGVDEVAAMIQQNTELLVGFVGVGIAPPRQRAEPNIAHNEPASSHCALSHSDQPNAECGSATARLAPVGIFEAIFLGLLQGLTEFLPISSSAHIRIFGDLFGWGDPGAAFTAIIQIGTELAVLVYFWNDIVRIISRWFRALPFGWKNPVAQSDPDVRMGWIVIIATLPIGILGLLFQDSIETTLRNLYITALVLAVFGILLGIVDRYAKRTRSLDDMSLTHGLIIGLGQALALIPGVSRSGGTITTARFLGYTREAAARASFLLAVPAVLLSGFYQVFKSAGNGTLDLGPTILAAVVAFGVGYAVIVWFLKLIETKSFMPFVIYRVVLSGVVVALLATGALAAI